MDDYNKSILFNFVGINLKYNEKSFENIIIFEKYTKEFKEILNKLINLEPSIFGCYKLFENFPKNSFLYKFLLSDVSVLKNKSLEKDFNNNPKTLIKYTNKLIKDAIITNNCNDITDYKYSKEEVFTSLIILLFFFLQESIYGPSFFYIKETEKIDYEKKLESQFYNNIFFKIEENYPCKCFIDELSTEGEYPYQKMKLSVLFYVVYNALFSESLDIFNNIKTLNLWKSRLLFLNNKMLTESVFSVKEEGFKLFDLFLNENSQLLNNQELGILLLEKASYCLKFYKYNENRQILNQVYNLFCIKLNLTGIKSKKTKYQEDSTVQLVLQNKNSNNEKEDYLQKDSTNNNDLETKSNCNNKDTNNEINNDNNEIEKEKLVYHSNVKLDEVDNQNYLLEKPCIDIKEVNNFEDYKINIYDQLYVSALISEYKRTFADEELLREEILAYTAKNLTQSFNWLVFSKLLIYRSMAEDKNINKIERALLQIQSICDQHNDREPKPFERLSYLFTVDYPYIWQNKKKYAEMWMGYGSTMTAYDIFNELGMYDEAIHCLFIAGKTDQAKKLANERLEIKPEPSILCVLGELLKDEKYFYKALKISDNKFARAYRSLGYFYFNNRSIDLAIENFEKALKINPMFPSIYFTLGCLYLSNKNFEKAINCFNSSVSLNDENPEGWANLGICFSQIGKLKESLKCLDEAYKRNRKSWKILENILVISVNAKDISKLVFSIEHLFKLNMQERVKPAAIAKLIDLFVSLEFSENDFKFYRNKIINIFNTFTDIDGLRPEIWDLYCLYLEKIEIELRKNVSDEIKADYLKQIIELRCKQIRGYLINDWEKNEKNFAVMLKVCDKIDEELKNYQTGFDKLDSKNNKDMKEKHSVYMNQVQSLVLGVREKVKTQQDKNKEY